MSPLEWLNGGWRSSQFVRTITAAGGVGIDADGLYGFQCKDFANALAFDMGHPLPVGNAIVLARELADGWDWVDDPEPGDLAVRNAYFGGINYGDVVGITGVSGGVLSTIGQNQVNVSLDYGHVPTRGTAPITGFIKFLRLKGDSMDAKADETDIKRIYLGMVGRAPSGEELRVHTGTKLKDLIRIVMESQERLSYATEVAEALNGTAAGFTQIGTINNQPVFKRQ